MNNNDRGGHATLAASVLCAVAVLFAATAAAQTAFPSKTIRILVGAPAGGSNNHLGVEVLQSMAKIRMTHVPHKGMAPAITDLMGGHAQVLLVSLPSVQAQMNSGRLSGEIHKVLATDDMKKRFAEFGAEPAPTTPDAFGAIVKSEIAKWKKVVKDAHISAE